MLSNLKLPTILLGAGAMAAGAAAAFYPPAAAGLQVLGLPEPGALFLYGAGLCGLRAGLKQLTDRL